MKNKFLMFFMLLGTFWISGCEDRELATLKESVSSNTLNSLSGTSFVLTKENEANDFQTFTWTAVDFGFKASVNYVLQVDKASGGFEEPFDLASTNELEVTVKVSEINEALLALGLTPQQAASVSFRIFASVGSDVPPVISNVSNAELTPFATAFPPIYGMGAALKGWGPWPDNAVEFQSEE
ncbi:MAG: SusE domain-containing protein, partial [Cyclobacteriaceae bacterium]|nr:SusE domain-containing protein [Cyclobacteriaceae bacterium]